MTLRRLLLALPLLLLPLAAPPAAATPFEGTHDTPADVSGITPVSLPGGLKYYVLKEGHGLGAVRGQTVKVHYVGFVTPSGLRFDASYDRGMPLRFKLGAGEVIKGWDLGVAGMKVGEQRQLQIPSALAYGSRGAGDLILPNSDLVFDVELVGAR